MADLNDDPHRQHEQRLAAALRDLVHQVDIAEYRDAKGHDLHNHLAFLKAQAVVDEFGLTHEQLCATLDECGDDLSEAMRRLWRLRGVGEGQPATPGAEPVEYQTWRTGP